MKRDVESQAQSLVHTSVQDAVASAPHCTLPVLRRAIQLEKAKAAPRISLVKGLQAEARKLERILARAPKDAA